MTDNVLSFSKFREKKFLNNRLEDYQKVINTMDKLGLLEEMERFIDKRKDKEYLKSEENILRGIILFKKLDNNCETTDMMHLVKTYLKTLSNMKDQYVNAKSQA